MRSYSPEIQAALDAGELVRRQAIWFKVRDRSDDSIFAEGYWSDVYTRQLTVFDYDTETNVTRTYYGGGTLIEIDPLPRTATLQIRRPQVRMSHVNPRINDLIRAYDARQAPIEVHHVLFDPNSREQVGTPVPAFVGRVNTLSIREPAAGEPGSIQLELVSNMQEVNRTFSATRSSADQRKRNASDTFHDDAEVAAEFDLPWGQESET